jgi:hypothetical protein
LAQLYHDEFIWWENAKGKVLSIDNYWTSKDNCMFDGCLYEKHNSLNKEEEHTRFYLEEVIGLEGLTETQIRIFHALSPIWKGMVLERFYDEINWEKAHNLIDILKPDGELVVYRNEKNEEHLMIENKDDDLKAKIEETKRKKVDEMEKGKSKPNKYEKMNNVHKNVIQDLLKKEYERGAINKFVARDQAIVIKVQKRNEKKNNPKAVIKVEPTKIKGYKGNFDEEDKVKEFSVEEVEETLEWVKRMLINIKNLIPVEAVRILYDKWIILQKSGDVDVNRALRSIKDEV